MVILGGWAFLMSEVPLYRAGLAPSRAKREQNVLMTFTVKSRPESGRDCLACAIFARQRGGCGNTGGAMSKGSEEGSYLRLIDLCITQLQARA